MVIGSCRGSLDAFYSDQNSKKVRFEIQQNGTFLFGLTRIFKVAHFDGFARFVRVHQNGPSHLMKLLSPVPLFCILLTSTIN